MESSKRKINDNQHVKTVTSKFTALSIKQRQAIVSKFICKIYNTKRFNTTKI